MCKCVLKNVFLHLRCSHLKHHNNVQGIMEPPMTLFDEATKSWYDEQMMMSAVAAHGFSFYANIYQM